MDVFRLIDIDLILWRHADAGDALADATRDFERTLSDHGRQQAAQVARWLKTRLPAACTVLSSPAARARETAAALGVTVHTDARLTVGADVRGHLAALNRPAEPGNRSRCVVLVGHQPTLGRLASLLLCGSEADWSVKKGAVWWMRVRQRDGRARVVLRAMLGPDLA